MDIIVLTHKHTGWTHSASYEPNPNDATVENHVRVKCQDRDDGVWGGRNKSLCPFPTHVLNHLGDSQQGVLPATEKASRASGTGQPRTAWDRASTVNLSGPAACSSLCRGGCPTGSRAGGRAHASQEAAPHSRLLLKAQSGWWDAGSGSPGTEGRCERTGRRGGLP